MKKKIRTIIINEHTYIYVLKDSYQNEQCQILLKITLQNQKNLALVYHFTTWDDAIAGCPLLTGIELYHRKKQKKILYNLNHPTKVRELIEYGLCHKWTGEQTVEYKDGLNVLKYIGYDSDIVRPRSC